MIEQRMRVNKKKFGEFIAARREKVAGIETQDLLAKKLSVSTGYMGKLESGGGLPSFDLFIDLADVLLMTPGELMMVLAERDDPNKNYMEMNDWLYERLLRILQEYELVSPTAPNTPQPRPLHQPSQHDDLGIEARIKRRQEAKDKDKDKTENRGPGNSKSEGEEKDN